MDTVEVRHKHGDTFVFHSVCTDDAGAPLDISNYAITCQLRDRTDNLIADIIIQIDNGPQGKHSSVPMPASGWPVGKPLHLDIRYAINGFIEHTRTISLMVDYAVTRP